MKTAVKIAIGAAVILAAAVVYGAANYEVDNDLSKMGLNVEMIGNDVTINAESVPGLSGPLSVTVKGPDEEGRASVETNIENQKEEQVPADVVTNENGDTRISIPGLDVEVINGKVSVDTGSAGQ